MCFTRVFVLTYFENGVCVRSSDGEYDGQSVVQTKEGISTDDLSELGAGLGRESVTVDWD